MLSSVWQPLLCDWLSRISRYSGPLKWFNTLLNPCYKSPEKKQFNCHKRAASSLPFLALLPLPLSQRWRLSLLRGLGYCLWCHGYPVITHSMAAPPPFTLKPRRDLLLPKSNQLSPSPSTFTSDIVPDRLRTSLSTSMDGKGRGIFEKRLWS